MMDVNFRSISRTGITHRNMLEDIDAGDIPDQYGFQIIIETPVFGNIMKETRWVTYDTDGAFIIYSTMWGDTRVISERDITGIEWNHIAGLVSEELETVEREILWAEV